MSEKVKILNDGNFKQTISENKLSLVDFWATWCPPCKALSPTIDQIANEVGETVNICKIDIDQAMNLAEEYGIMTVPTIIIFKNGELKEKMVGNKPKSLILDALNKYVG
jgi:thioredoxin 1